MLFINGEGAATLPHITCRSGCSWDAFCLALPMHPNQLRGASLRLHRKALGSIRFTWLNTQPEQRRVRPDNTAYSSGGPSKASTPQTARAFRFSLHSASHRHPPGSSQTSPAAPSSQSPPPPLPGLMGEGCLSRGWLILHHPSRRCTPGTPTHSSFLNHSCLR